MITHRIRIRSLVLVTAVLAAFLAAATVEAEELKRVAERLLPFASGGEIRIDDKNGKLTVEAWPRREVRIQITRVVRAGGRTRAEELMKDLQAEVEVRKDRIDIQSRFPKRHESIGILDLIGRSNTTLQIHYYLQVPERTDLTLVTSNGEVRVRGITGHVDAGTTNGDIRVSEVKGKVELSTTNGEVHVASAGGPTSVHTTNGSVIAELRRLPPEGKVELGTLNGNVEAYFDSDLKATLEAQTTNGRVSIGFPITREGVMTSRTIRGTIQGGGAKITIGTTNGNVEVRRLGERRP
ncbi:MAG TPA: DUF4097 family beta strand repeat-containing protein [Candidatus Saccharimonadales bacterium]|nr:DUF4097 family beta strand repeat-containing protein [Candidatus Saccharimonadales bacterium]